MIIVCQHCGRNADKPTGAVNRARKAGLRIFCGKACASEARCSERTEADRKAAQAEYDRARRAEQGDRLLAEKRSAYFRDHKRSLAKQAERRKDPAYVAKMRAYQREWCRRPAYRAAKKAGDRARRAAIEFGDTELAEAFVALCELEESLRPMRDENKAKIGRINLCQNRRRKTNATR